LRERCRQPVNSFHLLGYAHRSRAQHRGRLCRPVADSLDLGNGAIEVDDIRRDRSQIAGDLLRTFDLLLDRRGNADGKANQLPDRAGYSRDSLDRAVGRILDRVDALADVSRGLCGLAGERLDLLRHDGKSAAGFTGARGLDRRIECKQIRLSGDLIDQLRHLADFLRHDGQFVDRGVRLFHLVDRPRRQAG
jgi:hypothetical protein